MNNGWLRSRGASRLCKGGAEWQRRTPERKPAWTPARLLVLLACAVMSLAWPVAADEVRSPPRRVVSMNLCTDQLAMLIAAPGQLHSVSALALDAKSSVLAKEARKYAINHGFAEEIFLMKPDLVLAGSFSTRATVAMLRRLGFQVEEFTPESSFADIHANMRRMGALLGQQGRAEALLEGFDAALAGYAQAPRQEPQKRPLAALYYANSYTSGGSTLAGEVVERAGLRNLGKELGLSGTARLALEVLVMNAPDIVISEHPKGMTGLAYEDLAHPALRATLGRGGLVSVPDKYTVCGTPFTAEAVRILAQARASLPR
jgi:iron complex transport system substrate-binding protein